VVLSALKPRGGRSGRDGDFPRGALDETTSGRPHWFADRALLLEVARSGQKQPEGRFREAILTKTYSRAVSAHRRSIKRRRSQNNSLYAA
jgi:hypothetical protein